MDSRQGWASALGEGLLGSSPTCCTLSFQVRHSSAGGLGLGICERPWHVPPVGETAMERSTHTIPSLGSINPFVPRDQDMLAGSVRNGPMERPGTQWAHVEKPGVEQAQTAIHIQAPPAAQPAAPPERSSSLQPAPALAARPAPAPGGPRQPSATAARP
ncbi:hypothetical protein LEMLEM_LOCUS19351, partial [Lemmus lemmus]